MDNSLINNLKEEIAALKCQLLAKEKELSELTIAKHTKYDVELTTSEICRYSRQILVPKININGQIHLSKSKVLIIGAGGLGCPSSMYLAAAGVGEITIIDDDEVELTNLHRQILHMESDIGEAKVKSVAEKLNRMNGHVKVNPQQLHVDRETICKILNETDFDVILDCTDNVATRYLLNDASVIYKKALISGSALQLEGQLTVYNYKGGPCYRCIFPKPPPPEAVTSCGDGGIVGPVAGTIGTLQALEAIKILTQMDGVLSQRLLLFDGADTTFRNVKLRPRNPKCPVCGDCPTVTELIDYEAFCGSKANDKVENIDILNAEDNVHVKDLFASNSALADRVIIDVRPEIEFKMCRLPNTINVPYGDIVNGKCLEMVRELLAKNANNDDDGDGDNKCVYVVCRRGNDSQRAAALLKANFSTVRFVNVSGGLHGYAKHVDGNFPDY